MFCEQCGSLIEKDNQFCTTCGAKAPQEPEPVISRPEPVVAAPRQVPAQRRPAPSRRKPKKSSRWTQIWEKLDDEKVKRTVLISGCSVGGVAILVFLIGFAF